MDLEQCQVPGCVSTDTHNTGICFHHWNQLTNGHQYKLVVVMREHGPNDAYEHVLQQIIELSEQVGRFVPMR